MKDYKIDEIQNLTREAAKHISDTQSEVWNTTEWNICHHMALELGKVFQDFNLDIELIKDDGRRPDIVIHHRGNNENNLVVFQAKIRPSFKQIQEDLDKIRGTFFREPYLYKYGIFISIGQLPKPLPEFDVDRIRFVEVYGAIQMTDEAFAEKARNSKRL